MLSIRPELKGPGRDRTQEQGKEQKPSESSRAQMVSTREQSFIRSVGPGTVLICPKVTHHKRPETSCLKKPLIKVKTVPTILMAAPLTTTPNRATLRERGLVLTERFQPLMTRKAGV